MNHVKHQTSFNNASSNLRSLRSFPQSRARSASPSEDREERRSPKDELRFRTEASNADGKTSGRSELSTCRFLFRAGERCFWCVVFFPCVVCFWSKSELQFFFGGPLLTCCCSVGERKTRRPDRDRPSISSNNPQIVSTQKDLVDLSDNVGEKLQTLL